MIRTIKEKPLTVIRRRTPTIPQLDDRDIGLDTRNPSSTNLALEALHTVGVTIACVSSAYEAYQQRQAVESQCRQEMQCSNNEVELARIAHQKHVEDCQLERDRLDDAFRTRQHQNAREDARFHDIMTMIQTCIQQPSETSNTASQVLPLLFTLLQQPFAAND